MDIKKEQNLKKKIASMFKDDGKVFIDGEISYTHLIDLARKLDEEIINKLLQDNETKNHFFKNISGNYNFLFDKFERFINSELLDNSYTSFKNKIGLTVDNKFIKDSNDIVLNFPFKDCYLEGGQTKDEGKEEYFYKDKGEIKSKLRERKEIFFNEYIAYDEIDSLLNKKAFCNFKRYTKNGTEEVKSFDRDENGIIKNNLIIKGNNLLALHSLYSEFKGKIKLIYIDPPYNTGNDTFSYNDNFNHSAWLVFMKDRLKIARDLLREDGVIFVQCDDNEQAYLKVLMDEIFGRGNFEVTITCKVKSPSGLGSGAKPFFDCTEFILVYSKNKNSQTRFKLLKEDVSIVCETNDKTTNNYNKVLEFINLEHCEPVIINGNKIYRTKDFKITSAEKNREFYFNNYEKIFRLSPSNFSSQLPNDEYMYFNDKGALFYKNNDLAFLKSVSRLDNEARKIYKQEWQSNLILGNMWQGLQKEGEVTL